MKVTKIASYIISLPLIIRCLLGKQQMVTSQWHSSKKWEWFPRGNCSHILCKGHCDYSIYHQSSTNHQILVKKVFFWAETSSAHWKATRGHIIISLSSRGSLSLLTRTSSTVLNGSRPFQSVQRITTTHCIASRTGIWRLNPRRLPETASTRRPPALHGLRTMSTSRPTTSYEVNTASKMGAAASRS